MRAEWDTAEVRAARQRLGDGPSMAVADLNLRHARTYGHGRARERRIDDALRAIASVHEETARLTRALVAARRQARGDLG